MEQELDSDEPLRAPDAEHGKLMHLVLPYSLLGDDLIHLGR